jgi:hypothetical protein
MPNLWISKKDEDITQFGIDVILKRQPGNTPYVSTIWVNLATNIISILIIEYVSVSELFYKTLDNTFKCLVCVNGVTNFIGYLNIELLEAHFKRVTS